MKLFSQVLVVGAVAVTLVVSPATLWVAGLCFACLAVHLYEEILHEAKEEECSRS